MLPPEAILQQGTSASSPLGEGRLRAAVVSPLHENVMLTFPTNPAQHVDEPGAGVLEPSRASLFESVFNSSLDGLILVEATSGSIQLLNPRAEELLGYSSAKLLGQPFSKLLVEPGEQGAKGAVHFGPVFAAQPFLTSDGRELKLDLTAVELLGNGGSALIMVTLRDAAERLAAENVLRASQERYRTIVEDQTEMIVRWKPDGEITFANGAFRRARGLNEKAAARPWSFSELRPASDAYGGSCHMPVTTPSSPISVREFRRESANGQVTWERWLDRALFNPTGELVEFQSVGRDTTSRKMLEKVLERERSSLALRVAQRTAELTAANQELARASRGKDEFLAQVSHELRAPLQAMVQDASDLKALSPEELPPAVRQKVAIIKKCGQQLLATIESLVEISRIEAGKLELHHAPYQLPAVCGAALASVAQGARERKITITQNVPVDIPSITGDAARMREMLVNLLENAVSHAAEGGEVGLTVQVDGSARHAVCVEVRHTGKGMSAEKLRKIFKPYPHDDGAAGEAPCAGISLVLTSRLAMAHGGSISVETGDEDGLRLSLRLPVCVLGAATVEEPEPFEEGGYPSSPSGKTVLIADGCEYQRRQLETLMRAQGHTVVQAASGVEAVDAARGRMVDLLICADHLSAMDGWQVAQALRESFALSSTPVIILQGLALPDEKEMAAHQNIAALLPKPVDAAKLHEAVRALLL